MSHKLLIGLEFDGEYDPRVRAELEQLLATLQTWQANVPTNDAQFIVAAADDTLTHERVAINSPTVRVDFGTDGVARWHTDGGMSAGTAAMMFGAAFAAERDEDQARWPSLALAVSSTASSSSSSSSSSTTTVGGHLHGLMRLLGDGATTVFNLLDIAEYLEHIGNAGSVVDPNTVTLSSDGSQVTFAVAPTGGNVLALEYVIASL